MNLKLPQKSDNFWNIISLVFGRVKWVIFLHNSDSVDNILVLCLVFKEEPGLIPSKPVILNQLLIRHRKDVFEVVPHAPLRFFAVFSTRLLAVVGWGRVISFELILEIVFAFDLLPENNVLWMSQLSYQKILHRCRTAQCCCSLREKWLPRPRRLLGRLLGRWYRSRIGSGRRSFGWWRRCCPFCQVRLVNV